MALHPFSRILIDTLEGLEILDGRFTQIKCVNVRDDEEKRGCFSLVFSAMDTSEMKRVALKFFDPDPRIAADPYRGLAFDRESAILRHLLNSQRCLQLVQELKSFALDVTLEGGQVVAVPCKYFAVEWLDVEIDHFFFDGELGSVEKLRLFNYIVLAVEALHRREVFHRDLKADNLRMSDDALRRFVIAIDLGTAARFESGYVGSGYEHPVGALIYAPPEAECGLAGNRLIAHFSDVYALGCLLFELFNPDSFYDAIRRQNADYDTRLFAMAAYVDKKASDSDQVDQWRAALTKYQQGVTPISINGQSGVVEAAIAPVLNEMLWILCHFDFVMRKGALINVRQKTQSLIKLLNNEAKYQLKLESQRQMRRNRVDKEKAKDDRLKILMQRT